GGAADACEDLPSLWEVPVTERVPDGDGLRGPGAATQDLVAAAEMHLRVFAVGEGLEAWVGGEVGGRPLPHVTEHLMAAEEAPPGRIRADAGGGERALVEV